MGTDHIIGVEIKDLRSHPDDRGFFRELIRVTDPFFSEATNFAQWSHSKMAENTVKAWHYHHLQTDWWYCPIGILETALYDSREESPTYKKKMEFKMGESELGGRELIVKIPPGVAHACKVTSPVAHLFYITSRVYDPNDEGRYPYNSPDIPHNWGVDADLIVSAKDRVQFVPVSPRKKLVTAY